MPAAAHSRALEVQVKKGKERGGERWRERHRLVERDWKTPRPWISPIPCLAASLSNKRMDANTENPVILDRGLFGRNQRQ